MSGHHHAQSQHPRVTGRLKRGSYYSRETGNTLFHRSREHRHLFLFLSPGRNGKTPASQKLVDLPGDEGRGYSKTAELGSFLGGALPGVPERDGAQTQGRARVRQPRGGGHPLRMPGEGRVGRGGRGD